MTKMRRCTKCGTLLPISEFHLDRRRRADGHRPDCKTCVCESTRRAYERRRTTGWRQVDWPRDRYSLFRSQAKRRGISFELTLEEMLRFWGQPCAYCGTAIQNIGLDRIDSARGYSVDNVVACCRLCNNMKATLNVATFKRHIALLFGRLQQFP